MTRKLQPPAYVVQLITLPRVLLAEPSAINLFDDLQGTDILVDDDVELVSEYHSTAPMNSSILLRSNIDIPMI